MNQNDTIQHSTFNIQHSPLTRELRPLLRLAQNWLALLIVFAALGLALLLSYQVRPSIDLPIDSPLIGRTGEPFFTEVYEIEHAKYPDGSQIYPYRWTQPVFSLELPGLAQQPLMLTLALSGNRPADQPSAVVTVTVGAIGQERQLAVFQPETKLREYSFLIPASYLDDGNLRMVVLTNGIHPANDNRDLGIILNRVRLTPAPNASLILPARSTSFWLALALALLLLGLARLGWGQRTLLTAGLLFALASGLWLTFDRLFLTALAPQLWQALLAAYIGLVIADYILRLLRQYRGELVDANATTDDRSWSAAAARWLLTIFFTAFAIRLSGQLHPQIRVVDLFFHVHRLEDVLSGNLLFKIKSAEWGGQETFYLPTTYLPVVPLYWLTGDKAMAVRIFTVALDSSAIFIIATIARQVARQLAGIGAALLYVAVPIGILPFSWGITSNLFGQYTLLWGLALLVCGVPEFEDRLPLPASQHWRPSWQLLLFLFFLTLTLLSHPGVVPLAGLALVLLVLARAVSAVRRQRQWRGVLMLMGAGVLVALLAFGLYYRNFVTDTLAAYEKIQQQRAASQIADAAKGITFRRIAGGSVNDPSIGLDPRTVFNQGQWLAEGIAGFFKEAWAYYAAWPMLAALGYALLWQRRKTSPPVARLLSLMFAWVAAACLFAVVGLVNNLYVRYALFLLPIVVIGGGILLAQLWRERWGRSVALLLAGFTIAAALLLWYNRIIVYQHG